MKAEKTQGAELADRFFELLGLGRSDAVDGLLADEVEFQVIGRLGIVPMAGAYQGRKAVLGYLRSFLNENNLVDTTDQFHLEDDEDDREFHRVSSHVNIVSDVRSTGRRYDLEFLYKWELNDALDKVRNLTLYYSTWHLTEAFMKGGDDLVTDRRGRRGFFRC